MVGYMFSVVTPPEEKGVSTANLDFPRMLPGHKQAAKLSLERASKGLMNKGVSRVIGRVMTMGPGDIRLAEKMGSSIYD